MTQVISFSTLIWCALMTLALLRPIAAAEQSHPLAWRDATSLTDLVSHLDGWLDQHTDLPRSGILPEIRRISLAQAAQLYTPLRSSQQTTIRGLYDARTATIYLVRPWDARNPFDVAVLLHELVHHRQSDHGHWYCPGAQELPAYRTQQTWLAEMGLKADINWIAVLLEAGCTPRDIHAS